MQRVAASFSNIHLLWSSNTQTALTSTGGTDQNHADLLGCRGLAAKLPCLKGPNARLQAIDCGPDVLSCVVAHCQILRGCCERSAEARGGSVEEGGSRRKAEERSGEVLHCWGAGTGKCRQWSEVKKLEVGKRFESENRLLRRVWECSPTVAKFYGRLSAAQLRSEARGRETGIRDRRGLSSRANGVNGSSCGGSQNPTASAGVAVYMCITSTLYLSITVLYFKFLGKMLLKSGEMTFFFVTITTFSAFRLSGSIRKGLSIGDCCQAPESIAPTSVCSTIHIMLNSKFSW